MVLWCDGGHGAVENMRRDAALLAAVDAGTPPVLRLFRFVPAGITLGRAQDPARELDLARCAAAGLEWAVRPTGGRAIYHDEEWTYSLAAGLADPRWGGSLEAAYASVSRLLAAALERLGVPVRLARGEARGLLAPRVARGAAPPCFASTARHEIVIEGRKLVGSAQRRTAHALLQQGSILLGPAHLRLPEFLAVPEPLREGVRAELERAAADTGRWLGPHEPLERLADALAAELPEGAQRLDGPAGLRLLAPEAPSSPPAG